jgi:recombination protein RecA
MDENKKKALSAALGQIEKQFGKGSIMRMGDNTATRDIEAVSTGSLGLDIALGLGGLPRGRIVEIYGPESSGKTTLTLHAIAEMQKTGGTAAFIDAEHALDPIYAEKLGVDIDNLLVSQPDTGEQALEITDSLVRSGAVDIVVVDSVALVIFINQIRMKIGVMFGSPETTTGGNALKFYSSVRMDIRRIGAIKKGDEILGNETRVKVVKNKVSPPFKQVQFDILYGQGISREGEILDFGVQEKLIEKAGSWYSYNGTKIGQGKDNARQFLIDNPEIAETLMTQIKENLMPKKAAPSSEASEDLIPENASLGLE